jgi:hypothetical protein
MKLQEKFSKARLNTQFDSGIRFEIECEKIAEHFSITFYNWMQDNYYQVGDGFVEDRNMDKSKRIIITTEEAMKIFKQENGL